MWLGMVTPSAQLWSVVGISELSGTVTCLVVQNKMEATPISIRHLGC